jgi:cytochrome c biogenesis protein CcdA
VTGVIESSWSVATAFWLGLLTSISPCPLATNVAAVSFLGRRVDRPAWVLGGGALYAAGRAIAYVAVGALLLTGLLSAPGVSGFLQRHMNRLLGPVLIVVGLFLLEVIRFRLPGLGKIGERIQERLKSGGMWGAFPLGVLFALTFCPVSAALFFGSLISLALKENSPVLLPSLYGAGTAFPVVAFALLIAFGARGIGIVFNRLAATERWLRRATALVIIGVGIYMTISFTFGISF